MKYEDMSQGMLIDIIQSQERQIAELNLQTETAWARYKMSNAMFLEENLKVEAVNKNGWMNNLSLPEIRNTINSMLQ